ARHPSPTAGPVIGRCASSKPPLNPPVRAVPSHSTPESIPMKKIPLSHVNVTDELRQAVLKAVDSGRYILADQCQAFEKELAAYVGMKHCVLSTSWTTAVYLLHGAMGLKDGDEVIVPSHTAFPSIEPMVHHG